MKSPGLPKKQSGKKDSQMTFPAESQVSDLSKVEQGSVGLALIYSSKVELWVKGTHERVYYISQNGGDIVCPMTTWYGKVASLTGNLCH